MVVNWVIPVFTHVFIHSLIGLKTNQEFKFLRNALNVTTENIKIANKDYTSAFIPDNYNIQFSEVNKKDNEQLGVKWS